MEFVLFTYMVLLGMFSIKCLWWAFDLWFKTMKSDAQKGLPKMQNPPPVPIKQSYNELNAINEYWKNTQQ